MKPEQDLDKHLIAQSENPSTEPPSKKTNIGTGFELEARHIKGQIRMGDVSINDISMSVQPGELVILTGPEGPGVSAVIRTLAGLDRAPEGEILINQQKLSENYKVLKNRIGFIPAEDITISNLTVNETLDYASRLRLPRGTSLEERNNRVEKVLSEMNLGDVRAIRVDELHADGKKRVCLAMELLVQPGIIFLEDPFAVLDAQGASHLFRTLRHITEQGLAVILTTHSNEFFSQADKLGFLTGDQSLAWFGPPQEAVEYFAPYIPGFAADHETTKFAEIFDLLDTEGPGPSQAWASAYQASPASQRYTGGNSKAAKLELALDDRPLARTHTGINARQQFSTFNPAPAFSQWVALSLRYFKQLIRSRSGLVLMLAAPIIIACSDFLISSRHMYDPSSGDPERISISLALIIFLAMALAGIVWRREFQKEAEVYRRERQVSLKIFSYAMSKVWVVGLLAIYQGFVWSVVHIIAAGLPFSLPVLGNYFAIISLVCIVGGLLGLLTSVVTSSEGKSLGLLAIILIPQLIFSGVLLPYSKLNPVISSLASFLPAHYAFQGLSTADGHGKVLANDYCWQLSTGQQQALTEQQKQADCSCMGINIFSRCNFPGILHYYNQALEQPQPTMPTADQAFKFPDPPTPAPGESLDQYSQDVKGSFATAIEANLATAGIYQNQLTQYLTDLTSWESQRNAAVSNAEGMLGQQFENFAMDYNASLLNVYFGLLGWSLLIAILLIVFIKRKDFQRNEAK